MGEESDKGDIFEITLRLRPKVPAPRNRRRGRGFRVCPSRWYQARDLKVIPEGDYP